MYKAVMVSLSFIALHRHRRKPLSSAWLWELIAIKLPLPGGGGGGGVLPYMGYIGMCSAKGYGFSAVLVINRVSSFAL